jgi:uncharacterized protein (TIGR01440 family)
VELPDLSGQVRKGIEGLLAVANLCSGQIVVVGCSTSEIAGQKIGSASNMEIAWEVFSGLIGPVKEQNLYLAVQCCEHLNRALVVEEECAEKYGLEIVTVIPQPKAGGSLATMAMESLCKPVVVEWIAGHAGLDIGDTFIGMHLRPVAVPVRLDIKSIGQAHLTLARTRPKLIGGERARYK